MSGVAIGMRKRRTRAKAIFVPGDEGSRRSLTSWFVETVDGDPLALRFPLQEKLVEQSLMILFADAKAPAFFPKQQLFRPSKQGVSEVKFERAAICVTVRYRIDDGVARKLI
jgi:hypothetical protein